MRSLENLQRQMPPEIDAAIIFSRVNRQYLTGFRSSDGVFFVTRTSAVLIVDFRYIEAARAQAQGCEVVLLENRREQLLSLLSRHNVKTVGIEARELNLAEFNALRRDLPTVQVADTNALSDLIGALRTIKEPAEIECIKQAQDITDRAFSHILPFIKPGVAELDIALEIEFFMRKNGASATSFDLIVVSGENSSLPHGVPGDRKIQNGDFVTMDTGAVVGGYCSDMTRTVAVGDITDEMSRVYQTVLHAQLEAEKAIKAGVVCSSVDKIARDIIYEAGYRGCFGHGLGHSVGLEIHEEPRLSPPCAQTLRENMLMTVEPGIYLPGRFGVRIEDLVVVTESGCENLTQSPKELIVL